MEFEQKNQIQVKIMMEELNQLGQNYQLTAKVKKYLENLAMHGA